ncbi:MAG: hypothetical protein MJ218_02820 [Opitutales bacterium]|nr:hypothetical protein [Opitutales bacterium]
MSGKLLIIDSHRTQLQAVLLTLNAFNQQTLTVHTYTEPLPLKAWKQQVPAVAQALNTHFPSIPRVLIIPDEMGLCFFLELPSDGRFSLIQQLHRYLLKHFRLNLRSYCYTYTQLNERQYCVQLIRKHDLRYLYKAFHPTYCLTSLTGHLNYFNTLDTYESASITLFMEPHRYRLLYKAPQSIDLVEFYTTQPHAHRLIPQLISSYPQNAHSRRITIVGTLHPELRQLCQNDERYRLIDAVPEFSGDQLPIDNQVIYSGILRYLSSAANAELLPLNFTDPALKNPLQNLKLPPLVESILSKFGRKLLIANLALFFLLLLLHSLLNHKLNHQGQQVALLNQYQQQTQDLKAHMKQIEADNKSRTALPKTYLHYLQRLQPLSSNTRIDYLSWNAKTSQITVKGRTLMDKQNFKKILKPSSGAHAPPLLILKPLHPIGHEFTWKISVENK